MTGLLDLGVDPEMLRPLLEIPGFWDQCSRTDAHRLLEDPAIRSIVLGQLQPSELADIIDWSVDPGLWADIVALSTRAPVLNALARQTNLTPDLVDLIVEKGGKVALQHLLQVMWRKPWPSGSNVSSAALFVHATKRLVTEFRSLPGHDSFDRLNREELDDVWGSVYACLSVSSAINVEFRTFCMLAGYAGLITEEQSRNLYSRFHEFYGKVSVLNKLKAEKIYSGDARVKDGRAVSRRSIR